MDWQPKETAKKDGSRIIVLCNDSPQYISSVRWDKTNGYWIGGPYDNSSVNFDRWMPMPALPKG